MIGSFMERYSAKVCYGSAGGPSGGGGRGPTTQTINTKDKVNRDGTKSLTFSQVVGHIFSNSGATITISRDPSVTMTPTCGSCHDPVKSKK